jgi:hypothetical protein
MRHPGTFHLPWTPINVSSTSAPDPDEMPIPTSPALSNSALSPSSAVGISDTLAIKAAFGDIIVVFRISRDASLSEARLRITDKLAEQGCMPSTAFALAYSAPDPVASPHKVAARPNSADSTRTRSGSVSSVGDASQLRLIASEREWTEVVASGGPKVTLRVIDSRRS